MIHQLLEKIKEYDTIIIHRHTRPDGDALGSQLGLASCLKANYPDKEIYMVGEMNEQVAFLGNMDEIADSVYHNALAIILDVAVSNLVSDDRYKLAKEVFVIDHHTNPCNIPNAMTIIDSTYIACAERVAEILLSTQLMIPKESATALFCGIVTDSGRFQYNATTARTFLITSKLVDKGADMQFVYNSLYVESLESKRLKNYFSSKFEVSENGVGFMFNKEDVFEKFEIDFYTVSRGMIGVMAGISEIKIWCNFTIDKANDVIAGEFRSRNIPIVDVAKKYGGGGHDLACGASLASWDVVQLILADFEELAKNN